jgi:predicted amidohydrolase YtcJ
VSLLPQDATGPVVTGYGYRSATWAEPPTVAALDAVSGDHPMVLISGDGHDGWLNTRALQLLGAPAMSGALDENDWFPVFQRLAELPSDPAATFRGYRRAIDDAAAKGVVGIVDFELARGYLEWPERFAAGITQLRVRTATYPDRLDAVIAAGLRFGHRLCAETDLLTMGPLKVVSDGSLNRTAYVDQDYADATDLESRVKVATREMLVLRTKGCPR